MGLAVGSIGMGLADFCRCTPREFFCIYEHWERTQVRDAWERTRFLACCVLQPYSKKALQATDVCRFGWDKPQEAAVPVAESTRERFDELLRRAGIKKK